MKRSGLEDLSDFLRSLVRPIVTIGLVGLLAALIWTDRTGGEGFSELVTLTAVVVALWFGGRGPRLPRSGGGSGDAND